jgi:hypothetical protein
MLERHPWPSNGSGAMLIIFQLLTSLLPAVSALNNGLERTPAMGWNPYNAFT